MNADIEGRGCCQVSLGGNGRKGGGQDKESVVKRLADSFHGMTDPVVIGNPSGEQHPSPDVIHSVDRF
jgi:hypothetical protein